MPDDPHRRAPECEPGEAAARVGSDHDVGRGQGSGEIDDGARRFEAAYELGLAFDPGTGELGGRSVERVALTGQRRNVGLGGQRHGGREDRVGVWVRRPDEGLGREDKIAAIGIRVRRWVTLHGVSLNVDPNLSHFSGIVPCGVADPRYGVTSLVDLGLPVTMADVDMALRAEFEPLFGPVEGETEGRRLLAASEAATA